MQNHSLKRSQANHTLIFLLYATEKKMSFNWFEPIESRTLSLSGQGNLKSS